MGIDVSGWVEVWDALAHAWLAAIKVDSLVGRMPEIRAEVFGVQAASDSPPALAAGRGMPADASAEAQEIGAVEAAGILGQSWALWSELATTPWGQGQYRTGEPLGADWRMLFDLMKRLAESYGADRVRLVVWFW